MDDRERAARLAWVNSLSNEEVSRLRAMTPHERTEWWNRVWANTAHGEEIVFEEKKQAVSPVVPIVVVAGMVVVAVVAFIFGKNAATTPAADSTAEQPVVVEPSSSSDQSVSMPSPVQLSLGQSYTTDEGLTVTVTSTETATDLFNHTAVKVYVSYVNNGTSDAYCSMSDWSCVGDNGTVDRASFYFDDDDNMASGTTLAPGGTVSGHVDFETNVVSQLRYSTGSSSTPNAVWTIS